MGVGAGDEVCLGSMVLELKMGAIQESIEGVVIAKRCSKVCWDIGPTSIEIGLRFTTGVANVICE